MVTVMRRVLHILLLAALMLPLPAGAGAEPLSPAAVLDLARRGWVYELRTAMMRRLPDAAVPVIDAGSMRGAHLCLVGESPHPLTAGILTAFGRLIAQTSGTAPRIDTAPDPRGCPGEPVVLRLFSGVPPHAAYRADILAMNDSFAIGMSPRRQIYLTSPAQAQTFFGARGQATHLVVMQPAPQEVPDDLARRFFASLLIEELYQAFTFGSDVLRFDRSEPPVSKLQEVPLNLRGLPWLSRPFMEGMLATSPAGLCGFDLFMLHGLGRADLPRTNDPALLDHLAAQYNPLVAATEASLADPALAVLIDPVCAEAPARSTTEVGVSRQALLPEHR